MNHCADCRWWQPFAPRAGASTGLCTHLSCYRRGTPHDYACALWSAADAPAAEVVARCPRCGGDTFDVLICRACGERWHP